MIEKFDFSVDKRKSTYEPLLCENQKSFKCVCGNLGNPRDTSTPRLHARRVVRPHMFPLYLHLSAKKVKMCCFQPNQNQIARELKTVTDCGCPFRRCPCYSKLTWALLNRTRLNKIGRRCLGVLQGFWDTVCFTDIFFFCHIEVIIKCVYSRSRE